jgi:hypothetical protein
VPAYKGVEIKKSHHQESREKFHQGIAQVDAFTATSGPAFKQEIAYERNIVVPRYQGLAMGAMRACTLKKRTQGQAIDAHIEKAADAEAAGKD